MKISIGSAIGVVLVFWVLLWVFIIAPLKLKRLERSKEIADQEKAKSLRTTIGAITRPPVIGILILLLSGYLFYRFYG